MVAIGVIFIDDFAATGEDMELAKAGLIFSGGLLLVLAIPAAARAQMGGMGPGGAGNMMGNMMGGAQGQKGQESKSPEQTLQDAKKGMSDADPRVRAEALDKLRDVNDAKAQDILIDGLTDSDIRVKIRAIDILGAQQATIPVPLITQQLFLRETQPVVKLHIVAALGRIGDSRGTLPIIGYLKEAPDDSARGTAVFALGEIGDPHATDTLVQTVTNDKNPMVRKLAQESLEKIDGELPNVHSEQQTARRDSRLIPTDQRLSKMRAIDREIQKSGGGD
ncbi:MAG TPA: HEAT repeat domain-containing protein [Candidatus Binataceae bacterium]|nr:HEAT repeat domain-containing protein [Candidatus Binataceae bacterium]